jgi:threo-3-hydroxy-L-aspartate ammonia-lyase
VLAVGFEDVEAAARVLEDQVARTPCLPSARLSELLGCELTLKFETFQHSSSFKDRGACVKLASLSEAERARGVIAMSAGNHAQGVAHHATRLGIPATIVMPRQTPFVKVEKTTQFGARVVLEGDSVDEAADYAHRLAADRDLTFIHPYDDPQIIAGQGTIGLEMLSDAPDLEILVVPIGGGGLISGCATAAKALLDGVRVVGVEPEAGDDVKRSLAAGERVRIPVPRTIADGQQLPTPGERPFEVIRERVDEVVLATDAEIVAAMRLLFERVKTVAEPSGACALAALLAGRVPDARGLRVGVVISGGNVSAERFAALMQAP